MNILNFMTKLRFRIKCCTLAVGSCASLRSIWGLTGAKWSRVRESCGKTWSKSWRTNGRRQWAYTDYDDDDEMMMMMMKVMFDHGARCSDDTSKCRHGHQCYLTNSLPILPRLLLSTNAVLHVLLCFWPKTALSKREFIKLWQIDGEQSLFKTFPQDVDGVWWCMNTYTTMLEKVCAIEMFRIPLHIPSYSTRHWTTILAPSCGPLGSGTVGTEATRTWQFPLHSRHFKTTSHQTFSGAVQSAAGVLVPLGAAAGCCECCWCFAALLPLQGACVGVLCTLEKTCCSAAHEYLLLSEVYAGVITL